MYKLTIPGEPVAKGRPRMGKYGTYTPEKTKNYETLVKELYFTKHGQTMLEGEIRVIIHAYLKIPKSATKAKEVAMRDNITRPTKKPDLSNIVKSIEDALNGIAYKDDSQIVELIAHKYWSHSPRAEVVLEEIGAEKGAI